MCVATAADVLAAINMNGGSAAHDLSAELAVMFLAPQTSPPRVAESGRCTTAASGPGASCWRSRMCLMDS